LTDLLDARSHFAFGENWKSYLRVLDPERVAQAEAGMRRLFPNGELEGAKFLDIGSGSGLSSLSAARLGAKHIDAVDIDKNSVEATRGLLSSSLPQGTWTTNLKSVFDLSPERDGTYDVVYSWGVLHHTGDMWRAVRCAAAMVKPGGRFAVALYRKTPFCGMWTWEKRVYTKAPEIVRMPMRGIYKTIAYAMMLKGGINPLTHIRNYKSNRGMSWSHDVHDWMGGYPYESATPESVRAFLSELGFKVEREFVRQPGNGLLNGLLGSGCDEFVAVRVP